MKKKDTTQSKTLSEELEELEPLATTVKQRVKRSPIIVEGYIGNIRLKVTATPEDWQRLSDYYEYYLDCPYDLVEDFYRLVKPASDKAFNPKVPRGRHKASHNTLEDMRWKSAWLYVIIEHFLSNNSHPELLKTIFERAKKDGKGEAIKTKNGKYNAAELTAYVIEKVYSQSIKKYKSLKPPTELLEPGNFYKTYIVPKRKIVSAIFKRMTPQKIEALVSTNSHLRYIFTRFLYNSAVVS